MDGTPAVQHHEKSIIRACDADVERAVSDKTGRHGKNASLDYTRKASKLNCDYNDAHRQNMKVRFSKFPVSYPNAPLSRTSSWEIGRKINNPGHTKINTEWKLHNAACITNLVSRLCH